MNNEIEVRFAIDSGAFEETPNQKISGITLVIEYDNPCAYGYPEVCHWSKEYEFDVDNIRRNINVRN